MLFRKITAVYSGNHVQPIDTDCQLNRRTCSNYKKIWSQLHLHGEDAARSVERTTSVAA